VIDVQISACIFTVRVKSKSVVSLAGSVGDLLESYYCIGQMAVLGTFYHTLELNLGTAIGFESVTNYIKHLI